MSVILTILALILALLISDVISRFLPRVPGSLIQIMMGVVLALFTKLQVHLDQEWFLLLFIAPLLFNDGKRFPKRELWQLKRPIFENAILLVFITMFLGGFLLNIIIPGMPLAVCFALAAILSPTDPVAVQSIAKRSHLPSGVLHLVSGESLINDASGLIGFKYAVAAAVSGQFFLGKAVKDFLYISIVGFILGLLLMYLILVFKSFLYHAGVKGIAFNTVLRLVTPFLIYFVVEDLFHASGVISVVGAGILYNLKDRLFNEAEPELTLVTEKSWDVIIYVLNGIIFLLLGYSLPKATVGIIKNISWEALDPIYYALMTWIILFVIRFLWVLLYQQFHDSFNRKNVKIALLSAFSGVRGAITMVGVLSLPFTIQSGAPFPLRNLVLFIASFVIIWSLLAAIIFIPKLTSGSEDDDEATNQYYQTDWAYYMVIRAVLKEMTANPPKENPACVHWIIWQYEILLHRLNANLDDDSANKRWMNNQFAIQRVALDQERKEIQRLYEAKEINHDAAITLSQSVNRREAMDLSLDGQNNFVVRLRNDLGFFRRMLRRWLFNRRNSKSEVKMIRNAQVQMYRSAIRGINDYLNRDDISREDFDSGMVNYLKSHYQAEIQRINGRARDMNQSYYNVQIKAFGIQRSTIQTMLEQNKINWETANRLRQKVNYMENVVMQEPQE